MNPALEIKGIKKSKPCKASYTKLVSAFGSDGVVSLGDIAWAVGARGALWAARRAGWGDVAFRRHLIGKTILPSLKAKRSIHPRAKDCVGALDRWVSGDDAVSLPLWASVAWEYEAGPVSAALLSANGWSSWIWRATVNPARQKTEIIETFPALKERTP